MKKLGLVKRYEYHVGRYQVNFRVPEQFYKIFKTIIQMNIKTQVDTNPFSRIRTFQVQCFHKFCVYITKCKLAKLPSFKYFQQFSFRELDISTNIVVQALHQFTSTEILVDVTEIPTILESIEDFYNLIILIEAIGQELQRHEQTNNLENRREVRPHFSK